MKNIPSKPADITPDDIKLVTDEAYSDKSGNPNPSTALALRYTASFLQGCLNSGNRHFWAISKMFTDDGKSPVVEFKNNPSIFIKGYSYRAAQQIGVVGPCLEIKKHLKESDPEISTAKLSVATAAIESPFSAMLETRAAKDALKRMGKDIATPREFFSTASLNVFPLFIRGLPVWFANNSNEKDLATKAVYGGMAGIISAVPDSFANASMRTSCADKGVFENYCAALKAMNLPNTLKAAPFRIPAGALASVILSEKCAEKLCEIFNPLYQLAIKSMSETPSSETSAQSTKKLKEEKERGRDSNQS